MIILSRDADVGGKVTMPVNARCRIEFDISDSDLDQGSFGFDSYDKSKLGSLSRSDLKNQYHTPAAGVVFGDNYRVPWVSIRKGQTISFDINTKFRGQSKSITVSLNNADFTLSPTTITNRTDTISITCNTDLAVDTLLELKTNSGKVVGAINFWKNVVKTVRLEVISIGLNTGDINAISGNPKLALEAHLKKAFNPALIDFQIEYIEFDLTSDLAAIRTAASGVSSLFPSHINTYLKNIDNSILLTQKNGVRNKVEPSSSGRVDFLRDIEKLYNWSVQYGGITHTLKSTKEGMDASIARSTKITLYLTNMECDHPTDSTADINGNRVGKFNMMFLGNQYSNPARDIPHEIMHAFELGHTFSDANNVGQLLYFTKHLTKNYMDYYDIHSVTSPTNLNKKQTTYKWQWESMHNEIDNTYTV